MFLLAVFRSRAQSVEYAERLKRYGVALELVPTPREAKIGCGLCVRFPVRDYAKAKAVLVQGRYSTFKGFYKLRYDGGRVVVYPFDGVGR